MPTNGYDEWGNEDDKTARIVGKLVKYSREVNRSETVDEVAAYALEGTVNLMDGHPSPTVVEVQQGDLRVVKSMSPDIEAGGEPGPASTRAYREGSVVIVPGEGTDVFPCDDDQTVLEPEDLEADLGDSGVTIAAPAVYTDEIGDGGVIVTARWPKLEALREYHVKPLDYLADHVATAIKNIRSRDRLERAHSDLTKRKEMIEVYDRLLRHDLGNDLQVIIGFSEVLVSLVDEDDEAGEYAERIHRTAESATGLIDRVGELVATLEQGDEPEPRDLQPVVSSVATEVADKFDSLGIEFDPDEFDCRVYAGDLLDSILTNILSNAAVHNEGPVTVEMYGRRVDPDQVVVGIADDGEGISESESNEIFEMGKKGSDSQGSGFGLGLARALIESYGGRVDLSESESGGAEFRVTLERA